MRVVALCTRTQFHSTYKAAGVQPFTFPPYDPHSFHPALVNGARFLYVKLHGLPGQAFWYGDGMTTALSAAQLRQCNLQGAVVFSACCHLTCDDPDCPHPMLQALFAAGARAVIGGSGSNWARPTTVDGADTLGRAFRHLCGVGFGPERAFYLAKARVAMRRLSPAVLDALDFRLHLPDQQIISQDQEDQP